MTTRPIDYTAFFFFCGMGLGAWGFLEASAKYFGREARFRSLGGIDNDPAACADFEYLTQSPALCADIKRLTPAELREFAGVVPPDVIFFSAPCKAFSRLLNPKRREEPKYVEMARLALDAVELMVQTWDIPPRLCLFENVTGIMSLGAGLLREIRGVLTTAGYATGESTYDCGEIGGGPQHRRRFLLAARHKGRVMARVEQPPKQRVKSVGEVLGPLPLPLGSTLPMHRLSSLHWRTWVQLSLICPRGFHYEDGRVALGDYRDLKGIVADGQAPREVRARHRIVGFDEASFSVTGSNGANVTVNVSDPRLADGAEHHGNALRMTSWEDAAGTVVGAGRSPGSGGTCVSDPRFGYDGEHFANIQRIGAWDEASGAIVGSLRPSGGGPVIADPRFAVQAGNPNAHENKLRVTQWDSASGAVIGVTQVGSGATVIADPRPGEVFRGREGVGSWEEPAHTLTAGALRPSKGAFAVADPRVVGEAFDHALRVLGWGETSFTVAAQTSPGQGAYVVADPRAEIGDPSLGCMPRAGAYGVISWHEAMGTLTGAASVDNGAFAISDPRDPGALPIAFIDSPRRPPFVPVLVRGKTARSKPKVRREPVPVVIIGQDGCWHRPISPLEAFILQDGSPIVRGQPVKLHGDAVDGWIERIGNGVPKGAARAIAGQFLLTLLATDVGAGLMPTGGMVWVNPEHENPHPFVIGLEGELIPMPNGWASYEAPAGAWMQ